MDFERIFLGDLTWLLVGEIVLRTIVMYIYTLVLIRLLGKRGLSQLSPFELLIIVALGSAVGDPMFYPEVPLVSGMLVVTGVVALEKLVVVLTERNRSLERLVESTPVLLVRDGVMQTEVLDREQLSVEETKMRLRLEGVEYLADVRRAFLEPSGQVSVFWQEPRPHTGERILPEEGDAGV